MRELKDSMCKPLTLQISNFSAHKKVSRANFNSKSVRYECVHTQSSLRTCTLISMSSIYLSLIHI